MLQINQIVKIFVLFQMEIIVLLLKNLDQSHFKKGKIIDLNGNKIGEHEGIINYTIGQRKGIKISSEKPLYVININANDNTVIVGNKENLEIKEIQLRELKYFGKQKKNLIK